MRVCCTHRSATTLAHLQLNPARSRSPSLHRTIKIDSLAIPVVNVVHQNDAAPQQIARPESSMQILMRAAANRKFCGAYAELP